MNHPEAGAVTAGHYATRLLHARQVLIAPAFYTGGTGLVRVRTNGGRIDIARPGSSSPRFTTSGSIRRKVFPISS